jgi:HK97 family phage portal protein
MRVQAGRSVVPITKATEGEYRPGPWYLPVTGGWLSHEVGSNLNWWQLGEDVQGTGRSAMIEACIGAYSQTVAMCPGNHWRLQEDGGRERVTTSALSRILKAPNAYQTMSDFLLNGVANLYDEGNMYALAFRNSRYEPIELHLMDPRQCDVHVAYDGSIFYSLSGNEVIDRMLDYPSLVPARDVLHIKLASRRHDTMKGESPILSAARDVAAGNAMMAQQLAFYLNQARPSTVLSTDLTLDKEQVDLLRQRWDEQTRGIKAGGTPILTAGLKPTAMPSISANDSQLADVMKMSDQRIALAFRIPMQVLGLGGTNFNTTEALMQSWLATSLGFALNHVEESIGKFFNLGGYPDEYLEFDTSALLRSAFKERIEGLVRAVQGGVFSIDEARNEEGKANVKGGFGEEPRVQQQLVPLSAAAAIQTADANAGQIPPAPGAPPQPPAASIKAAAQENLRAKSKKMAPMFKGID